MSSSAIARIADIAHRRLRDTDRLSELQKSGEFQPPCHEHCEGTIRYEGLIGTCPLLRVTPPCVIPAREREERDREMVRSGFPVKYVKEASWDLCAAKSELQAWLRDAQRPGILIHGPVGTGKTMAATLVARELSMSSSFVSWMNLIMEIESRERRENLRRRGGVGMLVVDDFGIENGPSWVSGYIDLLFEERHSRKLGTIVTTNLALDSLKKEPEWQRIVDRWRESMIAVAMPGKSRRG